MSFAGQETSVKDGAPVSLFRFQYGIATVAQYFYTNADDSIDHAGDTYLPVPIDVGNLVASGKIDRTNLKVKISNDLPLAQVFRGYPPSAPINLTIFETHIGDPAEEVLVSWTGQVLSHARGRNNTMELSCEPVSATLKRPGLRKHYQTTCPHALYGSSCQVDKPSSTASTTVATLSGNKMTLAPGWEGANAFGKYVGGIVEWSTINGPELRSILKVSGAGQITMSGLPSGLAVLDPVDISLGCNHTLSDCENLHNNVQNFGGCPWIPIRNPVKTNPFS